MLSETCPLCKGKLKTIFDIGGAISEDGEERHHRQKCKICNKERFVIVFYPFLEGKQTYYGLMQ